tara:strand:+ start:266 stop:2026 length:1761 start_codon:yes stop_codon:yes gene_type:complete
MKFVLFFTTFLSFGGLLASDIEVNLIVDKNQVVLNEEVELEVRVKGARNVEEPNILNLQKFDVGSMESSSQIQIINGVTTIQKIFRYSLFPKEKGVLRIGPAILSVKGKKYQSDIVKIKVLKKPLVSKDKSKNYFLETKLDNSNVYKNQQVIYTLRFYSRVSIRDASLKLPEFKNFWKEQLGKQRSFNVTLNGLSYNVTEIKFALFPTNLGPIKIPSASLNGVYIAKGNRGTRSSLFDSFFNDQFFGARGKAKRINLRSESINLIVKDFPVQNRPDGFKGLVGTFKAEMNLDKNTISSSDSATLKIKVSGEGNIFDINITDFKLDGLKVYDDQPQLKLVRNEGSLRGFKVFNKAIVPQKTGIIEIPPFELHYFDPFKKEYQVTKSNKVNIRVTGVIAREEDLSLTSNEKPMKLSKQSVKVLGKDLLPIKDLNKIDVFFNINGYKKIMIWGVIFLLPFFSLLTLLYLKLKRTKMSDTKKMRSLGAYKNLGKSLKGLPKNGNDFFGQISIVLREYLGDKANADGLAITVADLERLFLGEKKLANKTLNEVKNLLITFDSAQYGGASYDKGQLLVRVKKVAKEIEKEIL